MNILPLTVMSAVFTQQAVILPIPKIDKDKSDPSSYRPIALTSCLCKVVECMISGRLVWYLEKNKLITNMQSGWHCIAYIVLMCR